MPRVITTIEGEERFNLASTANLYAEQLRYQGMIANVTVELVAGRTWHVVNWQF